jgi:hypothetical protein
LLVTTPEGLDSRLARHSGTLKGARWLLLDELHLLAGTARGDQLAALTWRLRLLVEGAGGRLTVAAASATLPEAEEVAARYLSDAVIGQAEPVVDDADCAPDGRRWTIEPGDGRRQFSRYDANAGYYFEWKPLEVFKRKYEDQLKIISGIGMPVRQRIVLEFAREEEVNGLGDNQYEKEKNKSLKIWEKNRPTREGCLRKICETDIEPSALAINPKVQSKINVGEAAGFTIPIERPKNKENRYKLIEKKREMFLVQQMLETKQREI